jgi:Domain of unknown function (DUF4177)
MTNWNYKVIHLDAASRDIWGRIKEDKAQQALDELGRQGWELVGILQPNGAAAPTLFLKRPA